jgi:hypothetical protein
MSITPSSPGQAKGERFEHGSVLGGKPVAPGSALSGNQQPGDPVVLRPGEHGVRGELGPIVGHDHAGLATPFDQRRQFPRRPEIEVSGIAARHSRTDGRDLGAKLPSRIALLTIPGAGLLQSCNRTSSYIGRAWWLLHRSVFFRQASLRRVWRRRRPLANEQGLFTHKECLTASLRKRPIVENNVETLHGKGP